MRRADVGRADLARADVERAEVARFDVERLGLRAPVAARSIHGSSTKSADPRVSSTALGNCGELATRVAGRISGATSHHRRRIAVAIALIAVNLYGTSAQAQKSCEKPLYLTFDTGHMGVAPLIADVLKRQDVKVTFFAANERTKEGGGSLGEHWAPWWKERAAEGHEFASHTFDHTYWRGDAPGGGFKVRPSAGPNEGQQAVMSAAKYCAEIEKSSRRLFEITGRKPLPLFRAPGGKTSPALLAAARSCGFAHVGWAPAGFLGDELPSERFSNQALLANALRDIRSGDILIAHLGIWSRKDPWAPAVLEPLIAGLKAKGFCFRTLRDHPDYAGWIAQHG